MTREQIQITEYARQEAAIMAPVSAYLNQPARPMPQWLGGERVWFPGEFGYRTFARPVWNPARQDWDYPTIEERQAA